MDTKSVDERTTREERRCLVAKGKTFPTPRPVDRMARASRKVLNHPNFKRCTEPQECSTALILVVTQSSRQVAP